MKSIAESCTGHRLSWSRNIQEGTRHKLSVIIGGSTILHLFNSREWMASTIALLIAYLSTLQESEDLNKISAYKLKGISAIKNIPHTN